jgi:hypothetical protein
MKTQTVHFTIGENAGALLMQIAQEHLTYGLDPLKSLKTICDSLVGCSVELAKKIIIGDVILTVDVENQVFEAERYNEQKHSDGFNRLDIVEWVRRKHKKIGNDGRMFHRAMENVMLRSRKGFSLELDLSDILDTLEGKNKKILDRLREDRDILNLSDLLRGVKKYIEESEKLYQVFEILKKWYPERFDVTIYKGEAYNNSQFLYVDTGRHQVLDMCTTRFRNLMNSNLDEIGRMEDELVEYIKAENKIHDQLSKKISPNPISDLNDASWIAPNGDHYGMNGTIANMIHNQIADKLAEDGIITVPDKDMSPDTFMRQEGWITIHNGWVLYDGYYHGNEITKEQQNALCLFGQHYGLKTGKMPVFGLEKKPISGVRIQMMDKLSIKKLFTL